MVVICKAGNRRGLVCDHKRNSGYGLVTCAIDATEKTCCFGGRKMTKEEMEAYRKVFEG